MHLIQLWICSKANEQLIQAYFSLIDQVSQQLKTQFDPSTIWDTEQGLCLW